MRKEKHRLPPLLTHGERREKRVWLLRERSKVAIAGVEVR